MKVFKELPVSLAYSALLSAIPLSYFQKAEKPEVDAVVSLTSIPSRMNTLHLVIRSLLHQTVRPRKIVLWLHQELTGVLPRRLSKLCSELFEIRFSPYTSSHRKLVHSLEEFPDSVIVTCDDDLMYRRNWLELLWDEHQRKPDKIIGNHTVHINHHHSGAPLPFRKWKYPAPDQINPMAVVPIGAWGILYPPHSLSHQTTNHGLYMELAPRADDLWFKAMAVLAGTESVQARNPPAEPIPIGGTQREALKNENLKQDKNTVQWNALCRHFDLSDLILASAPAKPNETPQN